METEDDAGFKFDDDDYDDDSMLGAMLPDPVKNPGSSPSSAT